MKIYLNVFWNLYKNEEQKKIIFFEEILKMEKLKKHVVWIFNKKCIYMQENNSFKFKEQENACV